MFENAYPVSRSQARRLYNTFDKFEEIVLDFKDIENMGLEVRLFLPSVSFPEQDDLLVGCFIFKNSVLLYIASYI